LHSTAAASAARAAAAAAPVGDAARSSSSPRTSTIVTVIRFLGERAGLVRADDGDRPERLDRRQPPDQRLTPQHALGADGQRDRDDRRQTLGDDGDGDADGGEDEFVNGLTGEGAHHHDKRGDDDTGDGEQRADTVEAALQRRRLVVHPTEQRGDVPQLGAHPGRHHQPNPAPVDDLRAGEGHAPAVGERGVAVVGPWGLVDRFGLAGQRRLLHTQAGRLDDPQVGWHDVARLHHDDVARHQLRGGDGGVDTVAPYPHLGGRHPAEPRDGPLGALLLHEPEGDEQHHDRRNRSRLQELAEQQRQHRGGQQDEHHHRTDLVPQQPQRAPPAILDQLVVAVLRESSRRLLGAEALRPINVEHPFEFGRVQGVPGGRGGAFERWANGDHVASLRWV
jgi:hypothetical protein